MGSGRQSGILAEGTFTADAELLAAMAAGGTYVNVHTNDGVEPAGTGPGDIPSGEIRGQVFAVGPEDFEQVSRHSGSPGVFLQDVLGRGVEFWYGRD